MLENLKRLGKNNSSATEDDKPDYKKKKERKKERLKLYLILFPMFQRKENTFFIKPYMMMTVGPSLQLSFYFLVDCEVNSPP